MNINYDVLIIGAGPCGLSTAIECQNKGLSYIVIEKGNVVEAIYHYPTHQTFFSSADKLGIGNIPFIVEEHKPKRNQALVYYRQVVKEYNLNIKPYTEVTSINKLHNDLKHEQYYFEIKTKSMENNDTEMTYTASKVVVATGYYLHHNELDVPGSQLEKVKHYFKEAHPYFNRDVLVIGGKNSSVDAAIELEKAGANVTVVYRGSDYSKSIKPWVLPGFESLVRNNKIKMYFNTEVLGILKDKVVLNQNGLNIEVPNDTVFAMIGYHPNYKLITDVGVEINSDSKFKQPIFDENTMETNVKGLYLAGVIAAGDDANKIFIENGKFHGGLIADDIVKHISHVNDVDDENQFDNE